MNETETLLTLDLQRRGTPVTIPCKKGDTARILHIRLREGSEPYVLEEGAFAVFAAVKSDGKALFNRCTLKDSDIFYGFTPETTSAVGLMPCEIRLYGGDGQFMTSAPFYIHVFAGTYGSQEAQASKDQQTALDYLIDETLNLRESFKKDLAAGAFQGASAYEVALENGFQGTEEQWLQSLRYDHSEEFAALAEQVKTHASQAEKAADRAEKAADRVGRPVTWAGWQNLVRQGRAFCYVNPGDQFTVDRVKDTKAQVSGRGITSAAADPYAFVKARDQVLPGEYSFFYDGNAWTEGEFPVDLKTLGITFNGSPQKGDRILITETAEPLVLDVIGLDYDVPAEAGLTHSLTLMPHEVVLLGSFCSECLLWACLPEDFPQGMAAGTYHFHLLKSGYNMEPNQDGPYSFTITRPIPVGGGIRHTTMGKVPKGNHYRVENILQGTFVTYDEQGKILEENIPTIQGDAGLCLGSVTARDPALRQRKASGILNHNAYGSNDWAASPLRQWLNSDEKENWQQRLTPWDLPSRLPKAGFLLGLDPSFVRALGRVRKRTRCMSREYSGSIYGTDSAFQDSEELVFLPGTTELGFGPNGGKNSSDQGLVLDSPVGPDGPRQDGYPVFKTDEDRVRYFAGAPVRWFHRGSYFAGGDNLTSTQADGTEHYRYAAAEIGILPCFCIV